MARWTGFVAGVLGFLLVASGPAHGDPCVEDKQPTLREDAHTAKLILYGKCSNPRWPSPAKGGAKKEDATEGATDFQILSVLKPNRILGKRKRLVLDHYIPVAKKGKPPHFIVFCHVIAGKIDPYRGVAVSTQEAVTYIKRAMALDVKDRAGFLSFFCRYLEHPNEEIAADAFQEFSVALESYKKFRTALKSLPADRLAKWLQDKKISGHRRGLYAKLVGHCGGADHAPLFRRLFTEPDRESSLTEGLVIGYTVLRPAEGWARARCILQDSSRCFLERYGTLRAVRFLWQSRPDLVDREELVDAMGLLLDQSDIADLAIEELRKWKRWEMTDRVLDVMKKKSHDVPMIRRYVLRFALCSPQPRAAAFVRDLRRSDPESVRETEEMLGLVGPSSKGSGK